MAFGKSLKSKASQAKMIGAVIAVALAVYLFFRAVSPQAGFASKAFFSTDDGATVFVDSADRIAPFDHDGKPAYRATMFSTDGGKTSFVAYLERYTPDGKSRMETALQDLKSGKIKMQPIANPGDIEVKLPGAGNPWVNKSNGADAARIVNAKVPAHPTDDFEIVFPS
jgi:hypothetical protein